jgi:hypothetical protein
MMVSECSVGRLHCVVLCVRLNQDGGGALHVRCENQSDVLLTVHEEQMLKVTLLDLLPFLRFL